MLRDIDPAKDNLADDEEIQELYRKCVVAAGVVGSTVKGVAIGNSNLLGSCVVV